MSANAIRARLSTMDSNNGNSHYQGCMSAEAAHKKKQNPSGLPFMALLRSQRPPRAHNVWNCHKKQKTQSFFLPLEYQSLLDHSNTPKWNESCGTYHPSLAAWDCWHMQGKKKWKQKQTTCKVTSPKPLPVSVQNSDVCGQKDTVWKAWHIHRKPMKL